MNLFNSFGLESFILYISYKVYVFWLIDLIKKEGWKYVEKYVGYFRFMYIVV